MGDFNFDSEIGYFGAEPENWILAKYAPDFIDCWEALHYIEGKPDPKNDGKTFDTRTNPNLSNHVEEVMRYDRVMLKSKTWQVTHCKIVGNRPTNGVCISDHYGLYTELTWRSS